VLGVFGETDRLSDSERERVVKIATDQAARRLCVTVGVSHASTRVTAERARSAEAQGADAVMVAPPSPSRDHFERVLDVISIPLVVQDYPATSGVKLPIDVLATLGNVVVKLEDPPTPPKIAALRAAAPTVTVLGGLGGVALLPELRAGSAGTMTGFAFPEALVEIVDAYRAGDTAQARQTWEQALPLMVFEAQPGLGIGLRKEILRRRGAIAHATVRAPAPTVDPQTLAELDALLALVPA
jgi:4-hydroxy-tetrahydrodipicolinate synthase